MRNARTVFALIAVAVLAPPALGKEEPARPRLSLRTPYMVQAVAGAHRITYVGELGGRGTLALDPNTCAVDAFGDPTVCTRIAERVLPVEMRQAKLADPSGQERRLYRLVGTLPAETAVYVVVPKRRSSAHRLIVEVGKDRRHVITLEPWARPKPPPKPQAKPLCKHAKYKAERKGSRILITAAGEHPSPGYKTRFEKLPYEGFPPRFRLVCEPPKGVAAAVMSPCTVQTSFDAGGTTVRAVIVHDDMGWHAVLVR